MIKETSVEDALTADPDSKETKENEALTEDPVCNCESIIIESLVHA